MNKLQAFVQENGRTPTPDELMSMMRETATQETQVYRKKWGSQITHPDDHKKKSVEGKQVKAERHAAIIRMTKEGYTQKQIAEHLGIDREDVLRGLSATAAYNVGTIDGTTGGDDDDAMSSDRQAPLAVEDAGFDLSVDQHLVEEAMAILDDQVSATCSALADLAETHADLPMAGRTWGQVAVPTSFGALVAEWGRPLLRQGTRFEAVRADVAKVSLSGAAGTLSVMGAEGPSIRSELAEALGLADPGDELAQV